MTRTPALLALAAAASLAVPASAQLVVDTFTRTTGDPDLFGGGPGVSGDWGSAEVAVNGGDYLLNQPSSEFDVEYVADGTARLNFGRVILDTNLATPEAVAAGGITIQVDVDPAENGAMFADGRDWAGFALGDSNSPDMSVGGAGFVTGGNADSRFAVAPRNSGTLLSNTKPGGLRGDGNPDGGINEPIIDADAYAEYLLYFNGTDSNGDSLADGDNFENDAFYTLELTVTETAPGNLFADGATLNYSLSIDGAPLVLPQAPDGTFVWGDNNPFTGSNGTDPVTGDRLAYLVFAGNTGEHEYDNLAVSLIPEPASAGLLAVGGLALLRRRRGVPAARA